MSIKVTQEHFICKSKLKHPDIDYSKSIYINAKTKIEFICPVDDHGSFFQIPSGFLKGCGCPTCVIESRKLTKEQFEIKAKIKHPDKNYGYELVVYRHSQTKVKIICPIHGIFEQTPSGHLQGAGCQDCFNDKLSKLNTYTTPQYIKLARKSHPDKTYGYELVQYKRMDINIKIICSVEGHGVFEQRPDHHLAGSGCKLCANEKHHGGYQLHKALLGYYKFSGYRYKIKMFNENENFFKIGVSVDPKIRFSGIKSQSNSKYNIEIVDIKFFEFFNQAIIEEFKLHEKYKEFQYIPKVYFGGHYECFSQI